MLKVYKTHESARVPQLATQGAACFDVHASLIPGTPVKCYRYGETAPSDIVVNAFSSITIPAGARTLIPLNLILDIPLGYSVRFHPRSGISLKQGLTLFNCEGVIDSDYVDPCFVTLYNISGVDQIVCDGDRIAQGELVVTLTYAIEETDTAPGQKTDRAGGFGSTGVKS
jgi:dUTP pyrophosphatase